MKKKIPVLLALLALASPVHAAKWSKIGMISDTQSGRLCVGMEDDKPDFHCYQPNPEILSGGVISATGLAIAGQDLTAGLWDVSGTGVYRMGGGVGINTVSMTDIPTSLVVGVDSDSIEYDDNQIDILSRYGNLSAGNYMGGIGFISRDIYSYMLGADIRAYADNAHVQTSSVHRAATSLVFRTRANLDDDVDEGPTERLRITSEGLVGIGTTSPATLLDVSDTLYVTDEGKVGIGTANPAALFSVGATSQFQIDTNGRISTGGAQVGNHRLSLNLTGTANGLALGDRAVNGPMYIGRTGGGALGGNAGWMSFGGDGTNTNNWIDFSGYGPTVDMRITNSGNVGISTTTPTAKLEVAGKVSATTVQVADAGETCTTSNLGAIKYNASEGIFYLCRPPAP